MPTSLFETFKSVNEPIKKLPREHISPRPLKVWSSYEGSGWLWKVLIIIKSVFQFMGIWALPLPLKGSLFSLFLFHSRKEFQSSLIFAGIVSGLHSWQILIFTYAYALIFIHRRFGSLFWLLGVLI